MSERFWSKVRRGEGCWEWTGSKLRDGRGVLWWGNRNMTAPRIAWEMKYGEPPPKGLHVCHSCDNPNCVNPDHLWLGTNRENMQDCSAKGRTPNTQPNGVPAHLKPKGEQHGSAKLTDDQVLAIRADPRSNRTIAPEYGVSYSAIRLIKAGRTWKHLEARALLQKEKP